MLDSVCLDASSTHPFNNYMEYGAVKIKRQERISIIFIADFMLLQKDVKSVLLCLLVWPFLPQKYSI